MGAWLGSVGLLLQIVFGALESPISLKIEELAVSDCF